mmetsp:Transcript_3578/g.8994  ORF Transcript_3578/g.8994 Transcript_3578/m.8994 type:complete len:209 (+) Transcript_3578:990-1616(+)
MCEQPTRLEQRCPLPHSPLPEKKKEQRLEDDLGDGRADLEVPRSLHWVFGLLDSIVPGSRFGGNPALGLLRRSHELFAQLIGTRTEARVMCLEHLNGERTRERCAARCVLCVEPEGREAEREVERGRAVGEGGVLDEHVLPYGGAARAEDDGPRAKREHNLYHAPVRRVQRAEARVPPVMQAGQPVQRAQRAACERVRGSRDVCEAAQ